MPRKNVLINDQIIIDHVIAAFHKTTDQERYEITLNWCIGHREEYIDFAKTRNLAPIGVLLAGMLEIEHPLITRQDGSLKTKSLAGAAARIIQAQIHGEVVHIPCVQSGLCTQAQTEKVISWTLYTGDS